MLITLLNWDLQWRIKLTYKEELFQAKCYGFIGGAITTVIFQSIVVAIMT